MAFAEDEFRGSDRFLLRRRLGAGGFGTVHEAFDQERRAVVALKVLRRRAPDDLARFKAEFRALADLSHPNVVTLYELCTDGRHWFFTMEYLPGVDLCSHLICASSGVEVNPEVTAPATISSTAASREVLARSPVGEDTDRNEPAAGPRAPLDPLAIRGAFLQLGEGLTAIHRAGKLHRDLKPSNVLVTREGRVVIVDLGLAGEIAPLGERGDGAVLGTPAYMSPEQARGGPVGPASDWYAVGVMLYRLLAGRLPFEGTAVEMLAQKQYREARLPSDLASTELGALCLELLRPDPSRRPAGEEVLARLAREDARSLRASTTPEQRDDTTIIGRERQLRALFEALDEVREGCGVLALCHGGSGMGKTRLCSQFLRQIDARGEPALVLAGRCYEYEAVPFKALDGIVDGLAAYLRRLPDDEVEAILPPDAGALCRVFSTLLRVPAARRAAAPSGLDARASKISAFAALRELFTRLGRRFRVVLFIDDLQWGDLDSVALLLELLRPLQGPALLMLASYRTEERETSPVLRALLEALRGALYLGLPVREIEVGELSAPDAEALAGALLGAAPKANVEAIAAESRGHPFLLAELCRDARAGVAAVSPGAATLEAALERRLRPLSGPARRLLDTVAVAGQPIARVAAERAAGGVEGDQDLQALASARAARWIRVQWSHGREELLPYHDSIRRLVVAQLSPEDLAACHDRLAHALEASGDVEPERLAFHFQGAGRFDRAARHAIEGAAHAARVLAFDRAARLYRRALDLGTLDEVEARRIQELEGDALAAAGYRKDAALAYLAAAEGRTPRDSRALKQRAMDQWLHGNHVQEGLAVLSELLSSRGDRIPSTTAGLWVSCAWLYLRIQWSRRAFVERDAAAIGEDMRGHISLHAAAGFGLRDVHGVWAAYFHMRALLLALRAGDLRYFAIAHLWNLIQHRPADLRAYEAQLEVGRALAERSLDPYAIGVGYLSACAIPLCRTDFLRAEQRIIEARAFFRAKGAPDPWLRDQAETFWLGLLPLLGRMKQLSVDGTAAYEEIVRRGVPYLGAVALLNGVTWMALAEGRPAQAETIVEVACSPWERTEMRAYVQLYAAASRMLIALYHGDAEGAYLHDEARRAPTNRRHATASLLGRVYHRYYHAQAALALAACRPKDRASLRAAAREASGLARLAVPIAAPMAAAIRAALAFHRGDAEEAIAWWRAAEASFQDVGMRLHAAAARRYQGLAAGGDEGAALIQQADAWMAGEMIRAPARMAAAVLPLGRREG
jgi:serine/threonine protein kinase